MIDENFARLMYDTQNMLWSYNSIILWNWDMQVQFRNCCKVEAQSNLQSIYIAMQDDKTKWTNEQTKTDDIQWIMNNKWWWEWYDEQWWCNSNEDILWWQTTRIATDEKWWEQCMTDKNDFKDNEIF